MGERSQTPDQDIPDDLSALATVKASEQALVPVPRLELTVQREAATSADRRVTIDAERCRIGSHPSNELVLNDPQVSRFHCCLRRGATGWQLTDTGSLNGTRVNGVAVRDADLPLEDCRIALGESLVEVSDVGSATQASIKTRGRFGELIGTTMVMHKLFDLLHRVAQSQTTVLIMGESGTGKEAVAHGIVRKGPRTEGPLIIVDCGAISPSLIESELFGHVKGAFTGADRDRVGAFEAADGGTLLLDEIGELPLELQPKLLRAIEGQQVRRVGENAARVVNVRLLAATNRDLEREVNRGRFREDLYFRLSVLTVQVPPLREHLPDVVPLVHTFLANLPGGDSCELFTPEIFAQLQQYDWPGNVRELRNYVERCVVLDTVAPPQGRQRSDSCTAAENSGIEEPFTVAKKRTVSDFERIYLNELMSWSQGNVSAAARKAGMDRMYLHRLLQKHGIKKGG